jgi:hypothetical protein
VIERPIRSTHLAVVVAALAALATLAVACGGAPAAPTPVPSRTPIPPGGVTGSGSPSVPPSTPPSTADPAAAGLLLEVTSEGGFINPTASIGSLPRVVVDADGRIFVPAAAPDSSQPLVPPVEVRDTGPGGAAAILAAIRAAGLDTEGSGGLAADTGSTIFTAVIDGETIVSRFASGGFGGAGGPGGGGVPGGPGGGASSPPDASSPPAAPGADAFALLARLTDPAETWGAAAAPVTQPFTPDAYLVFVAPAGAATGDAAAWPLSTAPDTFGTPALADRGVAGLRSGAVTGADARTLAAGLATAQAGSPVASGGSAWSVWVRPVLPDETGG